MTTKVDPRGMRLLCEQELAQELRVSVASLRRWRLLRQGPNFLKVGSLVRYRPDDIAEWLETRSHNRDGAAK